MSGGGALRHAVWLLFLVVGSTRVFAEPLCARVVSLAPSVTEALFDLGLGEHIVGATRFCRYPPEAQNIERVGGFYDVSAERIVQVKPQVIFVLKESASLVRPLARGGIEVVELDHTTISGIKESYRIIGRVCGVGTTAAERLVTLELQEAQLQKSCKVSGKESRRVMVVVGRTKYGNAHSGVYISGRDGFYSDILKMFGAVNVHQSQTVAVPSISPEGILKLAPEVIVEVVNVDDGEVPGNYMSFWEQFASVPAVKQRQVLLLTQDFASIPGPRYVQLAEALSSVLCQR
jgi:iron complex transport system substrate-binding protein